MITGLRHEPIIINDVDDSSISKKDVIDGYIRVSFTGDTLSALPSCNCGRITGGYSVGDYCSNCHSKVHPVINDEIEPIVWFRAPNGVKALMNPVVWIMLNERLTVSGFSVLQWLCDTGYRTDVKKPKIIDELTALNVIRGYNHFVEHFIEIVTMLFQLKPYRNKQKQYQLMHNGGDSLLLLLENNLDCVFSQYIPLPNKSLLIIQNTNLGIYIDKGIITAINAIRLMVGMDSQGRNKSVGEKENRAVRAIAKLSDYYESFHQDKLSRKQGIFRKHLFGSRAHFSFRAVVESITKPHNYDEIYIAWNIGVTVFRPHLINKLNKLGYGYNEAVALLYSHVTVYHPLLDRLLKELIAEAPNRRIPCIAQRNPSQLQGSMQLVAITRVKTDPRNLTVSISPLIITAPNGDYDGDCYNFVLAIDGKMAALLYNLSPHNNIMLLDRPRQFSNNISYPKTVVATISNWLSDNSANPITEENRIRFNQLPEAN